MIFRAMAPSTLSLFLTVLVFAGAQGATKDLDAACDPDPAVDTCTNSADPAILLICDALADPDVCKLQVDQTCNGGNEAKCVSGAACDTAGGSPSNECKCGSGHTATASKICAPNTKTGGACTGGPNAKGNCADNNAVCSAATDGTCGCKTGTTGVDGQGCTIDDNKFGGSCTTSTANTKGTCEDDNALCSATSGGTCACKTGYTGTDGAGCAINANKHGGSCTAATADTKGTCEDDNAQCSATSGGTCACKTGYTGTNGAGCAIDANVVGGSCTTNDGVNTKGSCTDASALCSAATAGTCFCKTGYTGTDGAGCVVSANKFGGSCTADTADTKGSCEDANALCSATTGGTCSCKTGYTGTNGAGCVADNKIDGACTGTADTKASCEDANALCTSSVCTCKPGYDGSAGGTCTKIADNTFGGSCTADTADTKGTCVDANALCSATTGGFCKCKTDYDGYAGSGCAMANKLGGKCTTMTKGTKGTCESDGAVCTMQVDGRCVMSGAKAVVASVTSLVLACIVCLLAIN